MCSPVHWSHLQTPDTGGGFMGFEGLLSRSDELIRHMVEEGYSEGHVANVRKEIRWIGKNGGGYGSYEEACLARESESGSGKPWRGYRTVYGILKRFDLDGELPRRGHLDPLFERDAYNRLTPEFREVVDRHSRCPDFQGLAEATAYHYRSTASSFLLAMQELGRSSLGDVTEDDVLAYFTDESGGPAYSSAVSGPVARALSSDLGDLSADASRVATYVPVAKDGRKNVQYLTPEEVDAIRQAIGDGSPLCLRDRAMGTLMLHTGMRASDVAALSLSDIAWESDEIRLTQQKTGVPLRLPLTAVVGNALYDYIAGERPASGDPHVFLSRREPHGPVTPGAVRSCAGRIYDAAGIRQREGDRRGTHLFRHNAATTMVASGTAPAVASAVLGHSSPESLGRYLSADVEGLRRCALDVSRFPVGEGAFDV